MLQMRFDHSKPGGNGEKGTIRIGALEKSGPLLTTEETAQKIARWLEEQGHSIEPLEEWDEEELAD